MTGTASWQKICYGVACYVGDKQFQADSIILASPEAGRGNCLLYELAPPSLPASQEDNKDKNIKKISLFLALFFILNNAKK